jgi:stage II sporulation protein D
MHTSRVSDAPFQPGRQRRSCDGSGIKHPPEFLKEHGNRLRPIAGTGTKRGVSFLIPLVTTLMLTQAPIDPGGRHVAFDLLYTTQITFAQNGVPVVSVGLMEGQEEITVTAPSGLRVKLAGAAATEVLLPPGAELSTRVEQPAPGKSRWRVVLEGVKGGNFKALKFARERWKKRKIPFESIQLGGVVGYPGRLLDNRVTRFLEKKIYANRDEAKVRVAKITDDFLMHDDPPGIFEEPIKRPSGMLVATIVETGVQLKQHGMFAIEARDGGLVQVKRVEYGRTYKHHNFQDRTYHGSIVLTLDTEAKLTALNRVNGELLLRGLVPSEIFPSAHEEALKAQATTARGELLAKLGVRHLADPYLVCSTQHCQVYSGKDREHDSTNKAVADTHGLMLFAKDDHLVDSVYSASCGGHSEHNENVWEGLPKLPLRGVADAPTGKGYWKKGTVPSDEQLERFIDKPPWTYCGNTSKGTKVFRWKREYPQAELDRLVNAKHTIGSIHTIEVLGRGVSGRVRSVRFTGDTGTVVIEGELSVRRLLGNLRSGMFIHHKKDDIWFFKGGGWGHGVGMCQYGAIGMAEAGRPFRAILKKYYGGSKIEKVY